MMNGTDVVDAGLNGAETINKLMNDKTMLQLALIILAIGVVRMLFKYFAASKDADKEVAKIDEELVKSLAERGFDAEGNRIEGYENSEQALFERRGTFDRSRIHTERISSRHYSGSGAYEGSRRNYEDDSEDNGDE